MLRIFGAISEVFYISIVAYSFERITALFAECNDGIMKKTLFMLPSMALGGTEKSLLNLLDTMDPDEHDVTLLLCRKEGALLGQVPQWVKVTEVPDYDSISFDLSVSPFILTVRYAKRVRLINACNLFFRHLWFRLTKDRTPFYRYVLRKHHFEGQYDTAIAYLGPDDSLSAYVLNCISSSEKIQWIHFDVSKYLFHKESCKKLYREFDRINVVSEGAKDALLGILPELSSKTFVVHNVVSEKKCLELANSGQGFDDDYHGMRIITVGRLSEEKGQDIIPEIAHLLKEQGVDFRWYIIGEGFLEERIREESKKHSVEDCVILTGSKTNPYPYYKEADIYAQTSKHEGFGLTLAEAKVFHLGIVTTPCTGAAEQLNGVDHAYIINRNAKEFAEAIQKIGKERENG